MFLACRRELRLDPAGRRAGAAATFRGLPENPETKRRLKNLAKVTGLARELDCRSAEPASREDILRVHPATYVDEFQDRWVNDMAENFGGG